MNYNPLRCVSNHHPSRITLVVPHGREIIAADPEPPNERTMRDAREQFKVKSLSPPAVSIARGDTNVVMHLTGNLRAATVNRGFTGKSCNRICLAMRMFLGIVLAECGI